MNKEVMKLALEALELNNDEWKSLADSGDSGYWKAEDQDHYQQTNKAITALREALANEALDKKAENARELGLDYEPVWNNLPPNKDVEDALRLKRLSQLAEQPAQQEPVGWWDDELGFFAEKHFDQLQPIYKSPPQRTWVGLTDEEVDEWTPEIHSVIRAIESKLREKNT